MAPWLCWLRFGDENLQDDQQRQEERSLCCTVQLLRRLLPLLRRHRLALRQMNHMMPSLDGEGAFCIPKTPR